MRPLNPIKKYQNFLLSRQLKEVTIKNYLYQVQKFLQYPANPELNNTTLKKYQNYILKKEKNIGSINLHFGVLNDYLKFNNYKFRFSLLSKPNLPSKILTPKQLDKFFDSLSSKHDFLGKRNRLLIHILYESGLHISQVVKIKIKDLDKINHEIFFGRHKISITPIIWPDLEKYLLLRHDNNPYLFINYDRSQKSTSQYLSVRSVERIISQYAQKIQPAVTINPQILRHTRAWLIKRAGGQSQDLQKNLNLSNQYATKKYWQTL